jgi:hypothetical protein
MAQVTVNTIGPPSSLESLKQGAMHAVKFIPEIIIKVIGETLNVLKGIWNRYIFPVLHKIWITVTSVFGKEVERRKPGFQQDLKQQTEQVKQEAPIVGKSFWQKIKDIFKF